MAEPSSLVGAVQRELSIRTEPKPRCVLCRSVGKPLYTGLRDALFGVPGEWSMNACCNPDCGLYWLDPVPTKEDLPLLYRKYFFSDPQDSPGRTLGGTARNLCYGIYKSAVYLPATILGLQGSKRRMNLMYLDGLPPGALFDVGCGDGAFLHRMQGFGWQVGGVDVDPNAVASAMKRYGLNVNAGELADLKLAPDSFDAVTLKHVIEHVPEPVELLRHIRTVLKPGGRVVIVTPNGKSMGHRVFKKNWVNLDPPRHLQIFAPGSLQQAARLAELEPVEVSTSAANADSFAGASYGVEQYYREQKAGSPKTTVNVLRALKSVMFQFREFLGLRRDACAGEEAVLICRK